jgi:hypothetical protein
MTALNDSPSFLGDAPFEKLWRNAHIRSLATKLTSGQGMNLNDPANRAHAVAIVVEQVMANAPATAGEHRIHVVALLRGLGRGNLDALRTLCKDTLEQRQGIAAGIGAIDAVTPSDRISALLGRSGVRISMAGNNDPLRSPTFVRWLDTARQIARSTARQANDLFARLGNSPAAQSAPTPDADAHAPARPRHTL